MKKNELLSYVNDFLSLLYFKEGFIEEINSIALFGSVARGNFDKESDVDLFIDVKDKNSIMEIEKIVSSTLDEFELKAKDVWHIRRIKNPINCIAGLIDDETWKNLRREIESYGIMLFGKFKSKGEDLASFSLFEYSLKHFKQKDRVAFQRSLLGYSTKKKAKVYINKGLIDKVNGKKLENNNVMVPTMEADSVRRFFTRNKLTPLIKEIWFKE